MTGTRELSLLPEICEKIRDSVRALTEMFREAAGGDTSVFLQRRQGTAPYFVSRDNKTTNSYLEAVISLRNRGFDLREWGDLPTVVHDTAMHLLLKTTLPSSSSSNMNKARSTLTLAYKSAMVDSTAQRIEQFLQKNIPLSRNDVLSLSNNFMRDEMQTTLGFILKIYVTDFSRQALALARQKLRDTSADKPAGTGLPWADALLPPEKVHRKAVNRDTSYPGDEIVTRQVTELLVERLKNEMSIAGKFKLRKGSRESYIQDPENPRHHSGILARTITSELFSENKWNLTQVRLTKIPCHANRQALAELGLAAPVIDRVPAPPAPHSS